MGEEPVELVTDRLRLRALRADDATTLHEAMADPDNLTWWHERPCGSPDEARAALAAAVAHGHRWAVCLRGTDAAIGHLGFVDRPSPGGRAGFGYFLDRAHWGRGYATEAARAVLDHAFDEIGIAAAELWIYEGNEPSVRVAEKLGGRLVGLPHFVNVVRGFAPRGRVYVVDRGGPAHAAPAVVRVTPRLAVPDVRAAIDWYVRTLGWRQDFVVGDPPVTGQVASPGFLPSVALLRFVEGSPRPAEMNLLVPEDIELLAARAGAAVTEPLEAKPWGLREFAVADPWGHVLRFEGPS